MLRRHGKYTKIRKNNPLAVGQCDVSGFLGRRIDLVPDMQYIGDNLEDTGYLVIPRFLDTPNPQMLPPLVTLDPIPVYKPRPETT
jgi:hypothetical protein